MKEAFLKCWRFAGGLPVWPDLADDRRSLTESNTQWTPCPVQSPYCMGEQNSCGRERLIVKVELLLFSPFICLLLSLWVHGATEC